MFLSRLVSDFRFRRCLWGVAFLALIFTGASMAQNSKPKIKVIALAEAGGIHRPFVDAAKVWLQKLAAENNFSVDYVENTDQMNDAFLAQYQVFVQLNYPPYGWTPTAVTAFTKYLSLIHI